MSELAQPDSATDTGSVAPREPVTDKLTERMPGIDGLRGLAIALVLCHNVQFLDERHGFGTHLVEYVLNIGWVGVQLFFVLSGFLITRILLETRSMPHRKTTFLSRRALRIFPLYFLTLAFLVNLPREVHMAHGGTVPVYWPYWLYVSNWTEPTMGSPDVLPHLWSLGVEEQFYLVWPLLVYALSVTALWRSCLALAAISLAARFFMVAVHVDPEAIYMYSICRIDALAMGGLAALVFCDPAATRVIGGKSTQMAGVAIAGLALGFLVTHGYPRTEPLGQTVGYSTLAIGFGLLVLAAANADRERVKGGWALLRLPPLRTLGFYSYAIYLFHKPLHELVGKPLMSRLNLADGGHVLATFAYIALISATTLLMARASYLLIERPFLMLRPRIRSWRQD